MEAVQQALGGIVFILMITGAANLLTSRSGGSITLVVQKLSLYAAPRRETSPPIIEIVGRMEGIIAFLLSLMGFSPTAKFSVVGPEVRREYSSLFGQRSQFIPLRHVSNLEAGVYKPVVDLFIAAAFLIFGVVLSFQMRSWIPFGIMLLLAVVAVVHYIITKKFFIAIYAEGGPPMQMLFKPNVIEGVPIDLARALELVGVLREVVLQQEAMIPGAVSPGPRPALPLVPVELSEEAFDESAFAEWSEANDGHIFGNSTPAEPEFHESKLAPETDDEIASRLFDEAKSIAQGGNRKQAISMLRDIVLRYPHTEFARKARRSLEKNGVQI